MSFDESELHRSLPLEAGQSAKLSVEVNTYMSANLKIVLEGKPVNSTDDGNLFPRYIQPIADSPDLGDHLKPNPSNDKSRNLSRRTARPIRLFNLQHRDSSDIPSRGNRRPNTTDDVDDNRTQARRSTRYGSPQLENRFSVLSNSSSVDSLALEGEGHSQPLPVYKLASAEFELEYTGGPGANEGYYRKTKLCITMRVLPSFHFSHFDILPSTK